MAKHSFVRVLLVITAAKNWNLQQLDINNTFLNCELFEKVYMDILKGYKTRIRGLVSKLNKSIYD